MLYLGHLEVGVAVIDLTFLDLFVGVVQEGVEFIGIQEAIVKSIIYSAIVQVSANKMRSLKANNLDLYQ